jgi:hypothetical protein
VTTDGNDADSKYPASSQIKKRITGVLPAMAGPLGAPSDPYQSSTSWGAPSDPYQSSTSWGVPPNPYQPSTSWGAPPDPYQKDLGTGQLIQDAINADPSNPREIGITQLRLISRYHNNVLQQAEQSFRWALIGAGIGLIFFLASISFLLLKQPTNISYTSLISGSLVEAISAINFFLYGKASSQLASFHLYLDRTHRFLLADSVCESLKDDKTRDTTRSELIRKIMESNSST